jgi:hypothetical protein
MKTHLSDILPRLKKYSQSLDQTAMLVDKPWVVNAGNNEYQKLIFKRDGTLLLSRNGNLTDGKWEYLPGANSLIIDYGSSKVLYRHSYMDDAVLALRKDGPISGNDDSEVFLLANENEIKDANAIQYLRAKYLREEGIVQLSVNNGGFILAKPNSNNNSRNVRYELSNLSEVSQDGSYMSSSGKKRYFIENGKYIKVHEKLFVAPDVFIWASGGEIPIVGDKVEGATNGVFKHRVYNDRYKIYVENGTVAKVKYLYW